RGIDDFAKAMVQKCCLVDKTPLIEQLIHGGDEVTLITRPRRFGKTINQSMLRYFFEKPEEEESDTKQLFENTLISQNNTIMQHHENYPVISLTFKSAKLTTWEEAYSELCLLIRREIERHAESEEFTVAGFVEDEQESWHRLLNRTKATQEDWAHSLQLLCKLLTLHHNKDNRNSLTWTYPIVLIDEYDAPIHAAYTHSAERGESFKDENSYYRRMTSFMRSLLGNALKGNRFLYKAVLTGILRVAKEDIFSGLNNPGVYGVLDDRFASFFGFTEPETRALLTQRGLSDRFDDVRAWYDGYCIGEDNPVAVYNPWSLISYLSNPTKTPKPHWVNTSDNAVVHTLLHRADADTKSELLQLLSGTSKHVVRPILDDAPLRTLTGSAHELWSLLLASGYATCDKILRPKDGGAPQAYLRLPNTEVKSLYKGLVSGWFAQGPRKQQTSEMVKALLVGNGAVFTHRLQAFVRTSMSYFDVSGDDPERVYQAFILGLLVHLERDYRLRSEREAGDGRADILLIPKQPNQPGMILEFKLAASVWGEKDQTVVEQGLQETAEAALQQIKDKNYVSEFADQNCRFVLAVGISFVGKQLATAYERLA
ncbi:MAG: AAA family ATPase, partial [Myxococcota bacterium]